MEISSPLRPTAGARPSGRRSAHDSTVDSIGQKIVNGDYPAGSLLPSSEDLMARLGVSRTTLREALQTLTAKGMVAARAKVGTRVLDDRHWNMFDATILSWRQDAGIPEASLATLYEIRQSLEPVAAALAAERRSAADVEKLRGWAGKLTLSPDNVAGFVAADVAFHQLILEISGNPFMRSIGALISTALTASFTLSAPTKGAADSARVQRQHMDVVDAIDRRNAQRASDAMTQVILQGWSRYSGLTLRKIADVRIATFAKAAER